MHFVNIRVRYMYAVLVVEWFVIAGLLLGPEGT